MVADKQLDEQTLNQQTDNNKLKSEQTLADADSTQQPLMAKVASSIGEFNYQFDVNPIVMSKAPDPLASFDDDALRAQDEFFAEEEKKHRQNLHQLSLVSGIDMSRQMRQKLEDTKHRHEKTSLIQAMMAGKDPNEFVKEVNKQSDARHTQQQRVKKQLQTDVQQQETGVDGNTRLEARDDQVENAVEQSINSGIIGGKDVVGVKATDGQSKVIDTSFKQAMSVDTGEQEKVVVGQDDATLTNNDNAEYDPVDLLEKIQANFEITNAQQTVINSQPMINLDLRLGAIPSKVRDKHGFVVDLSKRDIAQIKAQLNKRLHQTMHYPVPIKTFNTLVAGNSRPSYSKTELSNTIMKGYHVDFSKVISKDSPLKFKAPVLIDKQHNQQLKPDFDKVVTPVDEQVQHNQQQLILRQETLDRQANDPVADPKREDRSKEQLFSNQAYLKPDEAELSN